MSAPLASAAIGAGNRLAFPMIVASSGEVIEVAAAKADGTSPNLAAASAQPNPSRRWRQAVLRTSAGTSSSERARAHSANLRDAVKLRYLRIVISQQLTEHIIGVFVPQRRASMFLRRRADPYGTSRLPYCPKTRMLCFDD